MSTDEGRTEGFPCLYLRSSVKSVVESFPARSFARSVLLEIVGVDLLNDIGGSFSHADVVFDHEFGEPLAVDEDDFLL